MSKGLDVICQNLFICFNWFICEVSYSVFHRSLITKAHVSHISVSTFFLCLNTNLLLIQLFSVSLRVPVRLSWLFKFLSCQDDYELLMSNFLRIFLLLILNLRFKCSILCILHWRKLKIRLLILDKNYHKGIEMDL